MTFYLSLLKRVEGLHKLQGGENKQCVTQSCIKCKN